VVMPIDRWSRITQKALCFALSLTDDVRCVHVQPGDEPDPISCCWEAMIVDPLRADQKPVPQLVALNSPYRYILQPLMEYILKLAAENESRKICVMVPELIVRHWWENLMHNRRADVLKVMLMVRGTRNIVVINIPWYLD